MWGAAPRDLAAAGDAACQGCFRGLRSTGTHSCQLRQHPPSNTHAEKHPSSKSNTTHSQGAHEPDNSLPSAGRWRRGCSDLPGNPPAAPTATAGGCVGREGVGPPAKAIPGLRGFPTKSEADVCTADALACLSTRPSHPQAEAREADSGCTTTAAPNAKRGPRPRSAHQLLPLGPPPGVLELRVADLRGV